jgi:hypothetical protein
LGGAPRIELIPGLGGHHPTSRRLLAVRKKHDSSWSGARWPSRRGRPGNGIRRLPPALVLACGILRIAASRAIRPPALAPVLPGTQKPFLFD